jgi:hypothetical protein
LAGCHKGVNAGGILPKFAEQVKGKNELIFFDVLRPIRF